ncbi:MAG: DUF898 family protein [Pikeienuella sp.]
MSDETADPKFWDLQQYKTDTVETVADSLPKRKLRMHFDGNASVLFWVALKSVIFTILTAGIYRFWMVTRLRRFYWGAIRIDGDPLEYTGRGIEKLLGFLLALVVLAIYLGAVNLGLTFAGLSLASDDPFILNATLNLTILAALPFIYYAIYRGQRYILARTRWRGIRFALAPGAWGYVGRAILLTLLTVVTLGLAYPYQQFKLAKYITDRAYFGDQKFEQHGSWTELFTQWVWIYIIGGLGGVVIWGIVENAGSGGAGFVAGLLLSVLFMAFLIVVYRYQIAAFKILWSNKALGKARFENDLVPGRVLGIMVGGSVAVGLVVAVLGTLIFLAIFGIIGAVMDPEAAAAFQSSDGQLTPEMFAQAWPVFLLVLIGYLLVLGLAFAFSQIFVTLRVLRTQVEGMIVIDPDALAAAQQRAHDASAEAGGFADALGVDIGAGV